MLTLTHKPPCGERGRGREGERERGRGREEEMAERLKGERWESGERLTLLLQGL